MPQISSFERQAVEKRLDALKTELYDLHDREDLSAHMKTRRLRTLLREVYELRDRVQMLGMGRGVTQTL
jgi:hypothetical protein